MRTSLGRVLAALIALLWMGCAQTNSDSSGNTEQDVLADVTEDAGGDASADDAPPTPEDTTPGTVSVPFAVDDYFIPSGYMGAGAVEGGIEVSPDCPSRPADAQGSCHAFTLNPTSDLAWGGVWWQYPEGNWGDSGVEGRRIAPGAKTIRFHAWSDSGGESVNFGAGMKGIDSFNAGVDVVLTDTPTEYLIYIGHEEYETVIGGFSWTIDSESSVSFYVDNIVWSDVEPENLEGCTDPNADNHVPGATVSTDNCEYAVEFSVDMGCSGLDAFDTLYVTGTFCDWCDQGYPLADEDGDGVYQATYALPPGEYDYTYQVDQFANKEDLADDVAAGNGACAPKNSGPFSAEYAVRVLTVETMPQVLDGDTYGSCTACGEDPPAKPEVDVTFQVDMSQVSEETFAGVAVCGVWNPGADWTCSTMTEGDAGLFSATLTLAGDMAYQYTYKWFADEADTAGYIPEEMVADDTCQVGGGNLNRVVELGAEDVVLDPACWAQCGSCDVEPPKQVTITFAVDMEKVSLAEGEGVAVCGSWNGWWPCTPMAAADDSTVYTVDQEFTIGGSFEFVYKTFTDIEDGETFTLEPLNGDGADACQIGDGNSNRSLVIDEETALDTVCWGLCGPCTDDVEIPGCMVEGATNHNPNATVDDESCVFAVTFHADLSCSGPETKSVYLNGPFNGWCGSCAAMTDEDGDGVHTLTLELAAGEHEFKFVTNGDQWEALDATEDESCTKTTVNDDGTFTNRVVTVVDAAVMVPKAQPGSCEPCPAPECGDGTCDPGEDAETCPDDCSGVISGCTNGEATNYNDQATEDDGSCTFKVDFKVDMGCSAPALSEGDVVYVMGLDTWGIEPQMAAELSDEDGDGHWEGSWVGPAGDHEYILSFGHWMADAGFWDMWFGKEDLTGQECATETNNRALSVAGPMMVEVTHSYCGDCPGVGEDIPGCTDEEASNFNDKATVDNGSCQYPVTFQVDMSCYGEFNQVFVNGEFNGWCGGCWEMTDEDGDGIYAFKSDFPVGPIEFKYSVDSNWEELTTEANAACTITSEDGQYTNRAVLVEGPTVVKAAAPGSCEACSSPTCGDGFCNGDETPESCADDCKQPENAEVHFNVEMGCSSPELAEGDVVYVMGLDNWGGDQIGAELADADGDGVWEGTWTGAPGDYEFVLSFGHWMADEGYWNVWYGKEDLTGQDCVAESGNRTLSADGVMELNLTHSYCGACPGDVADGKAEVEFYVDMSCSAPELSEGDEVYVMGMDAWGNPDQLAATLVDEDGDGIWEGSWEGDAGSYEYTITFGHWVADPGYWDMWFGHEDISGQECANADTGNRMIDADGFMTVDLTHSYCGGCPGAEPEGAEVAFSVDMGCSDPQLSDGDVVYIMGMDAWGNADQLAVELTDEDQDGIWEGIWSGEPGDYEYTISFGHWEGWWNMWFGHEDLTGQACINPESGNRTLSAAGSMEVNLTHSFCDGCPAEEPEEAKLEFSVDMGCSNPALSEGDVVYVMGLDKWATPDQIAVELSDEDQDGIWKGIWSGPPGDYAYILSFGHWIAETSTWSVWYGKEDLSAQACTDEGGNRTVSASGAMELNLAHSECDGCSDVIVDKGGCTDTEASNFDPEATFDDGTCVYPVTFQVDMTCYGAFQNVFVNGEFNGWCGGCWAMSDEDGDGIYTYKADFPKGGVEFKFSVDDNWEELQAGDSCTVTNGDYTNRYVEVMGPTVVEPTSPGTCSGCGQ